MERQLFVARERQLGEVDGFLNRALSSNGQVCFLMGEAGSGKTALITEFARRAQESHDDLVVAVGQSDAQTGAGDAYLPFREILGQLTGDVETELARGAITQENARRLRGLLRLSVQALVEVGPDLVGLFIPGAGLALRVGGFVAEKAGWLEQLERLSERAGEDEGPADSGLEQSHIFEQYTNVLKALAVELPLMLVLDDLHWADGASINLLFRLGRRIKESRILIVGTFRPDEVALGRSGERHPLEKVLAEFQRYFGDVCVDLGKAQETEGERFVNAFVDSEPNTLGEGFRQALYYHTGGQPLFTIELLRAMQLRGDLVRDEQGRWVEGPVLAWESLPARVEGVVKERFGRLEKELQAALRVGSVEGVEFTAEVVAGVQGTDARTLIGRLSGELDKQHRLVSARGRRRLADQRLSFYRFRHSLFQTYLYAELDEVEREILHEDVGHLLERLYGEKAAEIAVQLAHHFVAADVAEKARIYLAQAGEQAAARFANDEAVAYFGRALALTPETEIEQRYALLLAREGVYSLQGDRQAQDQDLAQLEMLADALDDDRRRAEVALRRGSYAGLVCDYSQKIAASQRAVQLSQETQDLGSEARGYLQWGQALYNLGDYDRARNRLERALSLARTSGAGKIEANSLLNLGTVYLSQGDYDRANHHYQQSLQLCQEIGCRRIALRALNNLAIVAGDLGDFAQAEVLYKRCLTNASEMGDRLGESMALNNLGVHHMEQSNYAAAEAYFEQALGIKQEIGDRSGEGLALMNIARILAAQGKYGRSQAYFLQCLDLFRQIEDKQYESETLSYLSLLHHHLGDNEVALELSQLALAIARQLDRNSQATPLTYLGHALAGLDRRTEAAEAYRQAIDLRREFGQAHMAMEPLAGLARVALGQDELSLAQTYVEEVLSFLEDNSLDGTDEPFRVYLTCYRVLKVSKDPRAEEILNRAHGLLHERASRISAEPLWRSFLENVAAHREIVREWTRSQRR